MLDMIAELLNMPADVVAAGATFLGSLLGWFTRGRRERRKGADRGTA